MNNAVPLAPLFEGGGRAQRGRGEFRVLNGIMFRSCKPLPLNQRHPLSLRQLPQRGSQGAGAFISKSAISLTNTDKYLLYCHFRRNRLY